MPAAGQSCVNVFERRRGTPDVLADPPLLERVIANLVSNAVRHSPAGRPVTIGASALAGRVELRVIDRGPGMQLAQWGAAFEPFQRLGDTDNTTGSGSASRSPAVSRRRWAAR